MSNPPEQTGRAGPLASNALDNGQSISPSAGGEQNSRPSNTAAPRAAGREGAIGVTGTPTGGPATHSPAVNHAGVSAEPQRAGNSNRKARGKGLSWNSEELVALCKAEVEVGGSALYGAGMKQAVYWRRLQAAFIRAKPDGACVLHGTGCSQDVRRWSGRSAESCGKTYAKILGCMH